MKDRKTMKSGMMWLLLSVLLAIAMVFIQTPAWAQVSCSSLSDPDGDFDNDGFTNSEECNGVTLADGSHFNGFKEGGDCLDPNNRDIFVILIPAAAPNSILPLNPLQYIYTLPLRIHEITPEKATSDPDYNLDRIVSPGSALQQKAVRLTEDVTPYDDKNPNLPLGSSGEGTPNARDSARIYTMRTDGYIRSIYTKNGITPPGDLDTAIIDPYIRHVIAHEFGHMVRPLAPVSQADYVNFAGYHYKSGTTYNKTNVILDQYVKYSIKGGAVTFYIGTVYTPADIAGIILRQQQ